MADKPIPFTGPMVRAILEGRKTLTRRLLEPQPFEDGYFEGNVECTFVPSPASNQDAYVRCSVAAVGGGAFRTETCGLRYAVGDRLWVREAWRSEARFDPLPPRDVPRGALVSFEADYSSEPNDGCRGRYRHGRFMPRWASRITLTVTSVRVERLQDISEEDAKAEGMVQNYNPDDESHGAWTGGVDFLYGWNATGAFRRTWELINGPAAWEANQWVAAYSFVADHRNIDAQEAQP
jgi:hypothetical protein